MESISHAQALLCSPYVEDTVPLWDTAAGIASAALQPFSWIKQGYQWLNGILPKPQLPAAPGHALVGSLPEIYSYNWDILHFLTSYQAAFGKKGLCQLQVGTKVFYIVSDPHFARAILTKAADFPRGESLRIWRKFSSDGLSEGAKTSEFRSQAQQTIGQEHFGFFFPAMRKVSHLWMQRLQQLAKEGLPIDLMHECERATLAAFGESILKRQPGNWEEQNPFNLEFENDECCNQFLQAFHTIFALISKRVASPLANLPLIGDMAYSWQYASEERAFECAKNTLYNTLLPIYSRLLSKPEGIDKDSKFYQLLQIFGTDIRKPDYDQMIDTSVGFIQASFETSSKALGWALHVLALYPAVQKKLRSELKAAFGNEVPANFSDLQQVTYLFQVIEEVLRLYPPFPFLLRDIVHPEKFDDFAVQKGGTFLISPLFIHRNAKTWGDDCETFRPERWTKEMLTDKWQIDNPQYLPFLGGIHRCPGRFFAKQELSLLLAHLLLKFSVAHDLGTELPIELEFSVTLQSKHPILVHLDSAETSPLQKADAA